MEVHNGVICFRWVILHIIYTVYTEITCALILIVLITTVDKHSTLHQVSWWNFEPIFIFILLLILLLFVLSIHIEAWKGTRYIKFSSPHFYALNHYSSCAYSVVLKSVSYQILDTEFHSRLWRALIIKNINNNSQNEDLDSIVFHLIGWTIFLQ